MLNTLGAGGVWTVLILAALAAGYVRVLDLGRRGYWAVAAISGVALLGSQFLQQEAVFRQAVAEDLRFLFWLAVLAIPVVGYGALVRWARRHAKDPGGGNGPGRP